MNVAVGGDGFKVWSSIVSKQMAVFKGKQVVWGHKWQSQYLPWNNGWRYRVNSRFRPPNIRREVRKVLRGKNVLWRTHKFHGIHALHARRHHGNIYSWGFASVGRAASALQQWTSPPGLSSPAFSNNHYIYYIYSLCTPELQFITSMIMITPYIHQLFNMF